MSTPKPATSIPDLGFMLLLLFIGSGLRLLWAADMEWKGDEIWMYETARQVADGNQPWPWLGMVSSTGLKNPGLSVWCFILLAYVAPTPLAMVRWIQGLNILAIWGLFLFCYWQGRGQADRPIWLWGIVLAAVSPLAVLFSRKIWAQDLLPIASVLFLIAHRYRHRPWGAFGWGWVGTLIGQLHMSGFFLAAGVWLWTLYTDWRHHPGFRVRWLSWLGGTLLGLIPLLPWLAYAARAPNQAARSWVGWVVPKYFIHWVTTSLGVNLSYSLGSYFWSDFLPQPRLFGVPTYGVAIAHGFLLTVGLWGLARWVRACRYPVNTLMAPVANPLGFYLRSFGFATGLIFTLFALNTPVHYVIVAFPMMYVWLAAILADQRRIWFGVLGCQVLIAIAFLALIHGTGGFADADYGVVYRLQSGWGQ
ncbi:MAG TPA: hypothetical protein IGR64_13400 [Leptolyngbyaceae cyanobacterium M65_K2018_010]|nr:hypothetical protein [Leptolyngbyaceae cyanobacterium M65_K2018_010]